ncbi:MAG: hypothetical protein F6K54_27590 [Okeania sp. SIO3B5]|uniref:hypothetical protein n=1 Tax=Okeania sp. SIO3B5 TaxID=2607811 RepID=UPI0013FFF486|nr:hypothetical protein [Okeania sp. SIO3B5]NEO56511.1 hypothetical protein [Okeania sp. SIO3B5]
MASAIIFDERVWMNGEYVIVIQCHNYTQILIVYLVDILGKFSYNNKCSQGINNSFASN